MGSLLLFRTRSWHNQAWQFSVGSKKFLRCSKSLRDQSSFFGNGLPAAIDETYISGSHEANRVATLNTLKGDRVWSQTEKIVLASHTEPLADHACQIRRKQIAVIESSHVIESKWKYVPV